MDGLYITLVFFMAIFAVMALVMGVGCQFLDGYWGLIECGATLDAVDQQSTTETAKEIWNNWKGD